MPADMRTKNILYYNRGGSMRDINSGYFQGRSHLNNHGDDMPIIRYVTTISSRQNNKIKKKSMGFLYMKMAKMISTAMAMTGFDLAK
jgi:hypothetical protein